MGWYNSNWQFRKKITIDNTKVNADLTDFPIYVDLSDLGTDFFNNVKADGEDIRVTKADGVTELAREVVSISNELEATSGSWSSGADTVETVPANTDGEIFFTINYDKNIGANYFMGGFSEEADAPATGYNGIDFAIYGTPNASLQVFENGTQVHNTGSAPTAGDIVSVNRNGSTGAITYKLNGTTFYTSTTSTTAELKGDITVNNSNDYISNIRMYDGTKTFFPSFDNLVNMINSHIGEAHFKADSVSSSIDTNFYIYYGNASATEPAVTDTYGRNNVWDSNFIAVYHLNEAPSATVIDSTGYADGTPNNMDSTDLITAQIRSGLNFDGSSDYVLMSDKADFTGNFTISQWVNPASTQLQYANIMRKHYANNGGWGIEQDSTNTNQYYCFYVTSSNSFQGNAIKTTLTHSTWQKFDCILNGTTLKHLLNSSQSATGTVSGVPASTFSYFNIGVRYYIGDRYFNGSLDEIRLSNIARSDDWLSTEYNNQNSASTFYSAAAQEEFSINIVSISPAHESTGNAVDTNLVITYDQNVTAGTGALTVTQRDGLIIGDGFAGKIGEMILTNENLSQDTIEKVEGYLAWKWFGINNPLPDSHPYKLRRPVI